MTFIDGIYVGALVTTILFHCTIAFVCWRRYPNLKAGELLNKRGDQLISAASNPETWKSDEQREAYFRSKDKWQREVEQWKASGK